MVYLNPFGVHCAYCLIRMYQDSKNKVIIREWHFLKKLLLGFCCTCESCWSKVKSHLKAMDAPWQVFSREKARQQHWHCRLVPPGGTKRKFVNVLLIIDKNIDHFQHFPHLVWKSKRQWLIVLIHMAQKYPLTELGVRRGPSSSWGPEMVALNPRLNPSALRESKPPEDLCRFSKGLLCPGSWLLGSPASQPAGSVLPQADLRPKLSLLIHFHQNPTQQHVPEEALVLGRRAQNHVIHIGMFKAPLSLTQAHPRQLCVRDFTVPCISVPEGWLDYRLSKTCPTQERDNLFFLKWITEIYVLCVCSYYFFRE